ncbi:hypothetical protein ABGB18_01940 [Nonomuraea sp. B12E4]|uniref:hypothetical protein n=1 Tax=Nonomuraea sp. B12E4 TaxID=3153564 RepID=UPI00325E4FDA
MVTRSGGGRGDPNDTGRPAKPLVSCPRHPSVMTSGACPACLREAARRQEGTPRPPVEGSLSEHHVVMWFNPIWDSVRRLRRTPARV